MTTEAPPSPAPRPAARVLTILVSLLVALLLAEVALRLVVPARTNHYVWPPGTYHTFKPRADLMPDYTPETRFSINSAGLRGAELGRDEELRVLAIGGSTTECMYHDDDKVWVRRIGTILSTGDRHVWSGGAGRSGAHTGDHVLHTKYLLKELPRMDVVVILAGVNDVNVALGMPDTYTPTPATLEPEQHEKAIRKAFMQVPGPLEDSWDYDSSFLRRSQLYQLMKRIKRQRSRDLGSTYHLVDDDTGKGLLRWRDNRAKASRILTELPDLTKALATFRANLGTIADLVTAQGSRLVLLTQPTLWRADLTEEEQKMLWMGGVGDYMKEPGHEYYSPGALAEAMRQFNEVTLSVCRERGLGCVDLAKELPKDSKLFYDDCHFGHTGSEKIAQAVASFLKNEPPFAGK